MQRKTVMEKKRKMLVIGLDGAPPELLFDKYGEELPHLAQLRQNGVWGKLQSCHPPITVPAWTAMMSSQDPGQLGCYGFRNRVGYGDTKMRIANSYSVNAPRVWDLLSRAGRQVVVLGVPQTYPANPVNGVMVSCFLAPSTQATYTYPPAIGDEIAALAGTYMPDVRNFRTPDKDWLLGQIYAMTEKRFCLVRHWLRHKPWDFFMFVEMGPDRLHHGFWKFCDPAHPKYEAGHRFENVLREYYRYLDTEIGTLLNRLDDNTIVFLLSDHGAQPLAGGICLNEWLMANGYLVLKQKPAGVTPLAQCEIDWTKTQAWAEGGYYGRLFLNRQGRETPGVVEPRASENLLADLAAQIAALPDHHGRPLRTKVYRPAQLYRECNGVPPDLLIYFDDLQWRSVGSLGHGTFYALENDTGPDEANHSRHGVFLLHDPRRQDHGQPLSTQSLYAVAPTILETFGIKTPAWMIGAAFA